MTIDKPGIYQIDAAAYHADPCPAPSLSSSIAKTLLTRSPMHAFNEHPLLNPDHTTKEKTEFDLGSAAHALLLEGLDRMVIIDADSYRTKAAQEQRDAARLAGKHPVLAHVHKDVLAMRRAALAAIEGCADLSGLTFADGKPEQSVIWQDGSAWCRARPDFYSASRNVVIDYKTTTDASPGSFSRQISKMGYHLQAAFYQRGIEAVTGKRPTFIFLAQDTTAPYACSFHAVAPSLETLADAQVGRAILEWQVCMADGTWPGYDQRIHYAEAQAWQLAEHEESQAEIDATIDGMPK